MPNAEEKSELRKKLEQYEGRIDHMYQDTKGFVTIGVGHLIKDVAAAQELDFVHRQGNRAATSEEIEADFEAVKKQSAGLFASAYKKYTKLNLPATSIDALTDKHIESFEKELQRIYGDEEFDAYPTEVRLALFDMIFNLGMPTLKNGFPSFNKAIKVKDWSTAAKESSRRDVAPARNSYVRGLFEKAANAKTS